MNTTRDCGCKSFKSCLVCESRLGIVNQEVGRQRAKTFEDQQRAVYCIDCDKAFSGNWRDISCKNNAKHSDEGWHFPGILVVRDFVSEREEADLIKDLDGLPWDSSQSGRRKQNFGPRANFKKRKAKAGQHFDGFPKCTEFVQRRFQDLPIMEGYQTVEQCSIEYRPETGACIDPHIDDCWIWGERIAQVHLGCDSMLTLFPYDGDKTKYNLADVDTYSAVVGPDRKVQDPNRGEPYQFESRVSQMLVRIPLPRRSLLVMYGQARYQWEHCVLREDVDTRRVIIAYRELTPPYLSGGNQEAIGAEIIRKAKRFW